ncbi:MAG: cytochrome c oxidase assembly factor Coa1 family protein [Anaerolineae bacterium]
MERKRNFGCGGCVLIAMLVLCCLGTIGTGSLYAIQNSELYSIALQSAQDSARAREVLGTPIEGGWLITQFNVESNNRNGIGQIEVPVSGPEASGIIYLSASYSNGGEWKINSIELEVNGERFSLGQ